MTDHDEADDAPTSGPPPSPDDRLWRHPSELGGYSTINLVTPPHRGLRTLAVGLAGGFVGAAAMLAMVFAMGWFDRPGSVTAVEQIQLAQPKAPAPSELAVAKKVIPALVEVRTTTATGRGSGTAVVFRDDGHILTTASVVSGAETLAVAMSDGAVVAARVIGVDRLSDVAVLKVDHGKMAVATLAMEADLQLGQPTIALETVRDKPGSPNISVGLISAMGRRVDAADGTSLHDMIQTNVHLTGQAAGSALVDSNGAVIGLVTGLGIAQPAPHGTRITATTTAGSGTLVPRYAIPMEYAKLIADELILTGRAAHPWLGVSTSDLSSHEADSLGRGAARVEQVVPGSPADRAGLVAGDLVVGVDGANVESGSDLVVALRRHRPTDSVGVTYLRSGKAGVALATLVDKPSLP